MRPGLPIACAFLLAACGGGGGGGSSPPPQPAVTLSPTSLTATYTSGTSTPLTVTATPNQQLSGTLYVTVVDRSGVLTSDISIAQNGSSYTATVKTSPSLQPGHYTGTFQVNICQDAGCSSPLAGSPITESYDFTVTGAPAALSLTGGTVTGAFAAGDPYSLLINTAATAQTGLPGTVYATLSDSTNTLLSTATLAAKSAANLSNDYILTVRAAPSLAAGHYTGTARLSLCLDQNCATPVTGSPVPIPFDIQIAPRPANAGMTSLTAWSGVGDWQTFQGNVAHSGYVPVTLQPTALASRWLWTAPSIAASSQVHGDPTKLSTVTAAAGLVYVSSGYMTYALHETDGSVAWQHDFTPTIATVGIGAVNPPAVSGGQLYVTTSGQTATYMWGLDAATGSVKFQTAFDAQWEHYLAPTVDSGTVFEDGGEYGGMYAFNATTGVQSSFTTLQQFDQWTPAVDSNYAYAYIGGQSANTPAQLNIIDRHTGAVAATIPDNSYHWAGYSMFSAPVLGQPGSVFAVNVGNSSANSLLDFDTNAQSVRWQVAGQYSGNPAYAAHVLYAVNTSPYRLEARSEADGSLLWSWSPPQSTIENRFIGDVLVTDNLVFVSSNVATYAIDLSTHQAVWSLPRAGRLALSANGVLYIVLVDYFGITDGTVLAVNAKT